MARFGNREIRHFIHPPFPADFGYDGLRTFDTSFSRDVEHHGRRFKLWSPNSSRLPVYPGLPPADFNMTPPFRYPRTDGYGGRFDWTLHPQYLDANRLHLPFITTPESTVDSQHLLEFTYLTSQWDDHPAPSQTTGTLSREYVASLSSRAASLEEQRVAVVGDIPASWDFLKRLVSEAPTTETLAKFGLGMEWEECVSQVAAVQRQLREKQAWLQMLRALQSTNWSIDISPVADGIGATHESYMGCWVNGTSEKLIRWLLYLGIPCFIVHEYRVGVLPPSPSEAHPLPSALEVAVQSPSGTHSLPPRPSHTHDSEGSGSDTYHGGSISLDLDSCQMTRRQSTIMPILSYKELCHEPSSSRFVVLSGIGLGTTVAEITASLRKPIMPGPEFSGCNVFVRACARLPVISEDEQAAFVIECGSEKDAALVCRLVHGKPIGDTIASARLASDDLIQTVALQPCDHPSSIIPSHLPPLPQRHSSSTKASKPDRRRSRQRANGHPLNYRPYQRLVRDGDTRNYAEGTQHVPSRSRSGERVQDRAANNAAARVRIARRQARPNSRLESQMSQVVRALGSLVDKLGMQGSPRPGF